MRLIAAAGILFLALGAGGGGGLALAWGAENAPRACRGLSAAVGANDLGRLAGLLARGCDPNAVDRNGTASVHWLGARPRLSDDSVLRTAKLLKRYGCDFKEGNAARGPDLIVNLAPRRLPKTLAFLAAQGVAGDYTRALRAVARGGDVESIRVLLDAGADPLAGAALGSALFDAAWEGQTRSVALMLRSVKDKGAAKVTAAYQGALKAGHRDTAQAFVDAGVTPAEPAAAAPSPCAPRDLTAEQRRLLSRLGLPNASRLVGLAGAMNCKLIQECGDDLLVDCNSAADGPAYYIDQRAPKVLATCGGACMGGRCANCPPKEWRCSCAR